MQDDLVGFRVGIPLHGNITVALWFGSVVRDTDPPAMAFAFHTAFTAAGVLRIEARDLTVRQPLRISVQRLPSDCKDIEAVRMKYRILMLRYSDEAGTVNDTTE